MNSKKLLLALALMLLYGCVTKLGDHVTEQTAPTLDYTVPKAPYGLCPVCNSEGVDRQRSPDDYDWCENNHKYKSSTAVYKNEL